MGNPHAVQVVADVECRAGDRRRARGSSTIARFPQRVNAGYMQVVDRANIRLRVWERGAGETLACGTGACAAVVAGIRRGLLDRRGARGDARRRADDRVARPGRAGADDRARGDGVRGRVGGSGRAAGALPTPGGDDNDNERQ